VIEMGLDVELLQQVITHVVTMLGANDEAGMRVAEQRIASGLRVTTPQVRAWVLSPNLVPLDYRLALSIWIEAAGRRASIEKFCDLGRQLREATQRKRAAHMVQGAVIFADQPVETRTDMVMSYAEESCRQSPPPPTPTVAEPLLRVMLEQLLARDEGHFEK
jgi:hypothetical protein